MERLTTRVEDKVYYSKGKYPPTTLCAEMETHEIRECMKKLAEYEDMNLTADETRDNASAFANDRAYFFEEKEKMQEEIKELKQNCDYWKREALKWANEIGEQRIGPLLWKDDERIKNERSK